MLSCYLKDLTGVRCLFHRFLKRERTEETEKKFKNQYFYDASERIHTFNFRFKFKAKKYMV